MSVDAAATFAVAGARHGHIYLQTQALEAAGAHAVGIWEPDERAFAAFSRRFPHIPQVKDLETLLSTPDLGFVTAAPIAGERAAIGVRCLDAGLDYLVDKPGVITRADMHAVNEAVERSGNRFIIWFHERLTSRSTTAAVDLVHQGAIGQLVGATILAPHQARADRRPDWFWDPAQAGDLISDLGSHHFDLLLEATNDAELRVAYATAGTVFHRNRAPGFWDLATVVVEAPSFQATIHLDWLSPDELGTWGDGRVFFRGTNGYVEVRREIDIGGVSGADHVLLVNENGVQRMQFANAELRFAQQYLLDRASGGDSAMPRNRWRRASTLALDASEHAARLAQGRSS